MKRWIQLLGIIALLGAGLLFFLLDPEEHEIFPRCMFNSLTGYYCPGCGSQRAVHHLLHFNLRDVVSTNALFIPAGLLIIYHYLHLLINRKFGFNLPNILYHKRTPLVILIVVVLFWILRNINHYPFTILAPA